MTDKNALKIPPFYYIHVLDKNSNVTRLEVGPQTFIRQDHEKIVTGDTPVKMIILPPRHPISFFSYFIRNYCEISDPVILDKSAAPVLDQYGQVCIKHGEIEIRFTEQYPEPFPLYPGETLKTRPSPLLVVKENTALRIEATRNFEKQGKKIVAGDEWLFLGPSTYRPRIEERV
jgi:major vault protein